MNGFPSCFLYNVEFSGNQNLRLSAPVLVARWKRWSRRYGGTRSRITGPNTLVSVWLEAWIDRRAPPGGVRFPWGSRRARASLQNRIAKTGRTPRTQTIDVAVTRAKARDSAAAGMRNLREFCMLPQRLQNISKTGEDSRGLEGTPGDSKRRRNPRGFTQ